MARRLVETGVPFVEVSLGGWDNHQDIFPTLRDDKLPVLDRARAALGASLSDLERSPWLPDLLICRKEHAQPVFDALAAFKG